MEIIPKFLKVNYIKGRGGQFPCLVVIHIVEGTAQAAIAEFNNPKTEKSSHYLIKKDGQVIQFLPETDIAWTQGKFHNPKNEIIKQFIAKGINPNQICISIENEGYTDITMAQYRANAELVKFICAKWNIPIDRRHIIRHDEITDQKTCPANIDVGRIVNEANAPTQILTAPIIPDQRIGILQKLLETYQKLLALLQFQRTLGTMRSTKWSQVRKAYLKQHNECEACWRPNKILRPLQVHHIMPFHLDKNLELDPNNLITLCADCHLLIGHLMNFASYNPQVREDAELWKKKIQGRPDAL